MLFGPIRAFDESASLHRHLAYSFTVFRNASPAEKGIGVFVATCASLGALPLESIFEHRRCTASHADLYPGFCVVERSSSLLSLECSELDQFVVRHVFKDAAGPSLPTLAGLPRPPLPKKDVQRDATETVEAPARRARQLAPGEQQSSMDMQSEHRAWFDTSRAGPRTEKPMDVIDELVSNAMKQTPSQLADLQTTDPVCTAIRSWMVNGVPDKVEPSLRALRKNFKPSLFREHDGLLCFVDLQGDSSSDGRVGLRCVLPESIQDDFVRACHEDWGHPGIKRTLGIIRLRAWWPTIKAGVCRVLANCPTCLFNKEIAHRGAQHIPDNGAHPWHSIQIDVVDLHKARSGKSKAVVFYDRFTKDIESFATDEHCSTDTILNFLFFEVVTRHGWPKVIYTDRGSNLISATARKWYEKMGIELRPADAHMHTAVAGCERFNATLREIARAAHFDHGFEWDLILPVAVHWYKQLVHSSTGCSPFYLNHGREAVAPWDIKNGPRDASVSVDEYVKSSFAALHLAWQCTRLALDKFENEQRKAHNSKYQTNVAFKKGDRVLIRQAGRKSKMHMPYVGPFKIEEVLERDRYRVSGRRNAKRDHHEFHISRLKLWPSGADDEEVYLSEDYFDVDKVVASKVVNNQTLYRVRWVGYGAADDSWIPFSDMNAACARAALDFIQAQDEPEQPKEIEPPATSADSPATVEVAVPPPAHPPPLADENNQGEKQLNARELRLAMRRQRMGAAPAPAPSRALKELS